MGEKANYWHNWMLPGSATLLVHRWDGINWAVLFNADLSSEGKSLGSLIDPLVHQAADAVRQWPEDSESLPEQVRVHDRLPSNRMLE